MACPHREARSIVLGWALFRPKRRRDSVDAGLQLLSDPPREPTSPAAGTATAPPPPTYSQDVRAIAIQTPLGKDVLLLRGLHGEEGLSRLFSFDLDLLCEQQSIDVAAVMGKSATVGIRLADGTDRFINGIINRIALTGAEGRFTTYRAELVPWTWLLTRTSDCRVFQNIAVPAIVEKVFKDAGFQDFVNRTQKSYPAREFTVQYRETDFNFVSRLLEQVGIYYFFEHQNGKHTLVLADAPSEHQPCPGLPQARFRALSPDDYEQEVVSSWGVEHEIRPGRYALGAYNFEAPNANLLVNVDSVHVVAPGAGREIYDYPGDYQKRDEGEKLVSLRIEEQETQAITVHGSSTCRTLASGYRFELGEHPHTAQNQAYVVTTVSHSVSEPSYLSKKNSAAGRYRNTFTAIPLAVPFRPTRITPRPVIHGVQTAVVVGKKGEELWVDKYGRVKVQFHWDREGNHDENSSCWIRVSQNWAGKRWGAIFLPRIGQEVIVEFLEGDPDNPIITGRVYNADQSPPYDLPAEQTKTALKSSSSKGGGGFNELRFEDKKGSEQLFIHGQRDLDFVVERESRELVSGERHFIVSKGRFEQVGSELHLKVGADLVEQTDGTRYVAASKGLQVKAGGVVIETDGELTLKAPGGFIVVGAGGITIQGKLVNINSGGTAASATTRAVKLPNRASSAGTGEPGGIEGEGTTEQTDPDLARVELYRKTYEENSAKMSDADKKEYQQALAELEAATARHDAAGIAAAKGKLDAILTRNNIPIPADPAAAGAAGAATPVPVGTGPAAGTAGGTLAGRVRVDGRFFVNDAGPFRPVFQSGLALLARSAAERAAFLDETAALGFNGVRVFAGDLGWANQTPESARAALPALLDEAAARRLYVYVCAITGGRNPVYDIEAHLRAVTEIAAARPNAILEVANEIGHPTLSERANDVPGLLGMARRIIPAGMPWTLGAPLETDEPALDNTYPTDGGLFNDAHLDRGRPFWDQVRRVREIAAISESTRKPAMSGEPIGAAEQSQAGKRESNPTFFFTLGALSRGFEVGSVFHSESGLHGELLGPTQRACAQAFIAGWKSLPTDGRLNFQNASWPGAPIRSFTGVVRVYSFLEGARGWSVVVGANNPQIEVGNGWRRGANLAERPGVIVFELAR